MTANEYLMRMRVTHARHEIVNTNMKLKVIAGKNGFSDYQNFVRAYKKYTGNHPSVDRQLHYHDV